MTAQPDGIRYSSTENGLANGDVHHKNEHPNKTLMKRMGSKKGSDPIPPDQYLCFLTSKNPVQRGLAWCRSKTIRQGHRSPYCVDENGRALAISDMARDLGWDLPFASKIVARLERMKLIARDAEGRLCLCGEVPDLTPERESNSPDCTEPHEVVCTNNLPTYILKQISNLTHVRQREFSARWRKLGENSERLERDAIAAARAAIAAVEARLLAEFDLRKKPGKKRRTEENPACQLTILTVLDLGETDSVQATGDVVQSAEPAVYNGFSHAVQGSPSLLSSEVIQSSSMGGGVGRSVGSVEPEADRPTDRPYSPINDAQPLPERLNAIDAAIPTALSKKLHDTPTASLIKEIDRRLDGAPVANFANRISERYAAINSLGLLKDLAADVGAAWRKTAASPPGEIAEPEPPPRRMTKAERREKELWDQVEQLRKGEKYEED